MMKPHLNVWPPLPPDLHVRPPRRALPYPLEEPECRIVAWARHGVYGGVRGLGLEPGDVVLVPAYHHGSEVEALLRAGLECRFYECDERLAPEVESLESCLGPRVRALYLIHVLGFPQETARWREWCDARELSLIEDAAQAWLAHDDHGPVGSLGDLAIFCLYKTFGLPESAAVIQASPARDVGLDPRFGWEPMLRRHGAWLASRSGLVWELRRRTRREADVEPGDEHRRDLDLRDPTVGPWRHTPYLLRRVADPAAAERRRDNYAELLAGLGEHVPVPFDSVPPGASPFAFPVTVRDKQKVRARLETAGITTLDLWARPHPALPVARFPRARDRRAQTIALPVHQELRPDDLRRIVREFDRARI